jgi:Uma2 family endonuclease
MIATELTTADQLLQMPSDGSRYELVAGELRKMTPAGWQHGDVGGSLYAFMSAHNLQKKLGKMFLAETGFLLARDPDTVRAPDIAFIHKDHLPADLPGAGYWPGAPDLAVEVVSPSDTFSEVDEKAKGWLAAGSLMVWVVNPAWHTVTIYRSATEIQTLTENDELTGDAVLPGFRCRIGEIFGNG